MVQGNSTITKPHAAKSPNVKSGESGNKKKDTPVKKEAPLLSMDSTSSKQEHMVDSGVKQRRNKRRTLGKSISKNSIDDEGAIINNNDNGTREYDVIDDLLANTSGGSYFDKKKAVPVDMLSKGDTTDDNFTMKSRDARVSFLNQTNSEMIKDSLKEDINIGNLTISEQSDDNKIKPKRIKRNIYIDAYLKRAKRENRKNKTKLTEIPHNDYVDADALYGRAVSISSGELSKLENKEVVDTIKKLFVNPGFSLYGNHEMFRNLPRKNDVLRELEPIYPDYDSEDEPILIPEFEDEDEYYTSFSTGSSATVGFPVDNLQDNKQRSSYNPGSQTSQLSSKRRNSFPGARRRSSISPWRDNDDGNASDKNSLEEFSPLAALKLQVNPLTGKRIFSDDELTVKPLKTAAKNETPSKSNNRRASLSISGRDNSSTSSRRCSVASEGNDSVKTDNGETVVEGYTVKHYERPRIIRIILVTNVKKKFAGDLIPFYEEKFEDIHRYNIGEPITGLMVKYPEYSVHLIESCLDNINECLKVFNEQIKVGLNITQCKILQYLPNVVARSYSNWRGFEVMIEDAYDDEYRYIHHQGSITCSL